MKHFFSVLLAVLFSAGIVAQNAQDVVTITSADAGTTVSGTDYEFTAKGVTVKCTMGAITDEYFNCHAGYSLTVSAEKDIKGIAFNGYVKKGYTATVSAGTVTYVDAAAGEVTADPVVVITDINAKSVTINNVKQLRCFSMTVYFDANPDVTPGGGGDDPDDGGDDNPDDPDRELYSYEWEPEEKDVFNLAFLPDEFISEDMTEEWGFSYLYFENETHAVELDIFATLTDNGLPADGTYPIDATCADNTVMASPGGDEENDYPSYMMTDFESDGEYTYYNPYYIVSGSVTIATQDGQTTLTMWAATYYGSTVTLTFSIDAATALERTQTVQTADKRIENGHVVIRRDGRRYNLLGTEF